jgi:hypothetical protein
MFFLIDSDMTAVDRAAAILSMVPEDRLEFILKMLENMALAMQPKSNA